MEELGIAVAAAVAAIAIGALAYAVYAWREVSRLLLPLRQRDG